MVTFTFAKHYPHDISGIDNPEAWAYGEKNGVYYPVNLLSDCVIRRPMYKTDPNYRKGMLAIFYKGELIKRHYDNPHVPDSHAHLPYVNFQYHDVDWVLAGYGKNP